MAEPLEGTRLTADESSQRNTQASLTKLAVDRPTQHLNGNRSAELGWRLIFQELDATDCRSARAYPHFHLQNSREVSPSSCPVRSPSNSGRTR
jgi:hypothetical protein